MQKALCLETDAKLGITEQHVKVSVLMTTASRLGHPETLTDGNLLKLDASAYLNNCLLNHTLTEHWHMETQLAYARKAAKSADGVGHLLIL